MHSSCGRSSLGRRSAGDWIVVVSLNDSNNSSRDKINQAQPKTHNGHSQSLWNNVTFSRNSDARKIVELFLIQRLLFFYKIWGFVCVELSTDGMERRHCISIVLCLQINCFKRLCDDVVLQSIHNSNHHSITCTAYEGSWTTSTQILLSDMHRSTVHKWTSVIVVIWSVAYWSFH